MATAHYRDVSPFLRLVRKTLMGREHKSALRQADTVSCPSQPPPNLPPGVSAKLFANYYYMRDGRRAVKPNEVLAINSPSEPTKLLSASPKSEDALDVQTKTPKTPGNVHGYGSGFY
ncbi:hypothetical protein OTU49_008877 [Cherax quadricarinatus]|uniref:NADH dehydrogenase [ubiquinone] 1 alpha subcomplex subunit 7 n=1 Tax=Cherax quadricarinatus TaxID=27406 RepID=A0AAW0WD20_CHEQU|nr:NADH dehydrogenase [ubiquinone] 1 alpha subcomplex subunit 7-like [Cherax quadricarinatus]